MKKFYDLLKEEQNIHKKLMNLLGPHHEPMDSQISIPPSEGPGTQDGSGRELGQLRKLEELGEFHRIIPNGAKGFGYMDLFGAYLQGSKRLEVFEPYLRLPHQFINFIQFCEVALKISTVEEIDLTTCPKDEIQQEDAARKFDLIAESLSEFGTTLRVNFNSLLHYRKIRASNGWVIEIDRGLDYFQAPKRVLAVGYSDQNLRRCLLTSVNIRKGE